MALLKLTRSILVVLFILGGSAIARADGIQLQESQIKGGLLYNFLKYSVWSGDDGTGPLNICVYGRDPFNGYLSTLKKMTVRLRPIEVRYIDTERALAGCNLLYINSAEKEQWKKLYPLTVDRHILTVADFEGFGEAGGIIQFTMTSQRISAVLNEAAAQRAGIKIGDRLLNLVTVANFPPP